jgi:hypothetical protein
MLLSTIAHYFDSVLDTLHGANPFKLPAHNAQQRFQPLPTCCQPAITLASTQQLPELSAAAQPQPPQPHHHLLHHQPQPQLLPLLLQQVYVLQVLLLLLLPQFGSAPV